tara:strand:+ start:7005 stop:7448 length:444 start_codon:yes stop_codon:yes gene_type:complete
MPSGLNLRDRALNYLARREYSRAELEKKLISYTSTTEEVSLILDSLERCGVLSAKRVVEQTLHIRGNRYGSRRIIYELQQKGINEGLISAVLPRPNKTELKIARSVWQKKFGVLPACAVDRARQTRFLIGRGFSTEIIAQVLSPQNK